MRKLAVFGVLAALTGAAALPEPAAAVQQPEQQASQHAFVALVTGSTGGLGPELARRLAADGAHVIVHGRNQERGNELVAEIAAEGKGSARFIAADLASFAEVRELATTILTAAVHPASMMNTDMVLERGARARSTVEEGAEAVMNAVRTPELESGTYFQGLQARQANAQAYDAEARTRLRALAVELTGVGGG